METKEILEMALGGLAKNVIAPLGLIFLAYVFNRLRPAIDSINNWVNKEIEGLENENLYNTILEAVKAIEKISENKGLSSEEKESRAYGLLEKAGLDPSDINVRRKLESAVKDLDLLEGKVKKDPKKDKKHKDPFIYDLVEMDLKLNVPREKQEILIKELEAKGIDVIEYLS